MNRTLPRDGWLPELQDGLNVLTGLKYSLNFLIKQFYHMDTIIALPTRKEDNVNFQKR